MGDEILSFDEHRRRRGEEDDDDDFVPCARCGKRIHAAETRCPECGVHFQGRAEDFSHPSEQITGGRPLWFVVVAIVLLVMMIFGLLL
jgi:hypothetical protein